MSEEAQQSLFVQGDIIEEIPRASTAEAVGEAMVDIDDPSAIPKEEHERGRSAEPGQDEPIALMSDENNDDDLESDDEVREVNQQLTVQPKMSYSGIRYLPGQQYFTVQRALRSIIKATIHSLQGDSTAKKITVHLRHDEAGVMNMRMADLNNSIESHYRPNLIKAFKHLEKQFKESEAHYEEGLQRAEDRKEYRRGVLARHRERFETMKGNMVLTGKLKKDLLAMRGMSV